jgi:hypothetical protein
MHFHAHFSAPFVFVDLKDIDQVWSFLSLNSVNKIAFSPSDFRMQSAQKAPMIFPGSPISRTIETSATVLDFDLSRVG